MLAFFRHRSLWDPRGVCFRPPPTRRARRIITDAPQQAPHGTVKMSDGKSSSVWSPEEDAELARLQVRSPPPVAISNTLLVFFWGLRAPASLRLPARRRPIGRSRVRPKRSPSIERTRRQEIHGNRWALVAAELPGKTGQQCAQRWRHKVNPAIKKEKWTPEEDAQVSNPLSSSSVRARDVGPIGGRVGFLAPEAASAPCATARATEEPPRPRAPAQILSPSFSPEPSKLTDAFFGVRNSSKQPLKNHGRRLRLRRPASDD